MDAQTIRRTTGRGRLFDSILDTVGDTPVVRINNLGPPGVRIYVKAEFFNPAASIKDRLALNIIEAAERADTLTPGQTVVEATSGNTGIGLAMVFSLREAGLSSKRTGKAAAHCSVYEFSRAASADGSTAMAIFPRTPLFGVSSRAWACEMSASE